LTDATIEQTATAARMVTPYNQNVLLSSEYIASTTIEIIAEAMRI